MKSAIYARKSTDKEDNQLLSIEQQLDANKERIVTNGDRLIGIYQEAKSAKKPFKRPEFRRLMDDVRAGKVEVIYCWKLNRLARNPIDGGEVQWLLQEGILKAIATHERTYLPSDNVIQMAVELGMATQYSRDLGKDVQRGMLNKVKMGWKPGPAPIGYLPDYAGEKGRRIVHKDPVRFDLVRKCFELLLSEKYTVPQIYEIATKQWGLNRPRKRGRETSNFTLSGMYQMFDNRFYCGQIAWKDQVFDGNHEPIVSIREFAMAMAIISRKGKPCPKVNYNPYAGIIHCSECGGMVVVEVKQKYVNTQDEPKEYRYYRCSRYHKHEQSGPKVRLDQKELDKQLLRLAFMVDIPQALVEWSLNELRGSQESKKEDQRRDLQRLQDRHKTILEKRSTLVDRQLDQSTRIPEDLYQQTLRELSQQAEDLQGHIRDFEAHAKQWALDLIEAVEFTEGLRERFAIGTPEDRLDTMVRLGQRIELRGTSLHFALKEPYHTLVEGKNRIEAKVGTLEPLRTRLGNAKGDLLDTVIGEWWSILEEFQTFRPPNQRYPKCSRTPKRATNFARFGHFDPWKSTRITMEIGHVIGILVNRASLISQTFHTSFVKIGTSSDSSPNRFSMLDLHEAALKPRIFPNVPVIPNFSQKSCLSRLARSMTSISKMSGFCTAHISNISILHGGKHSSLSPCLQCSM